MTNIVYLRPGVVDGPVDLKKAKMPRFVAEYAMAHPDTTYKIFVDPVTGEFVGFIRADLIVGSGDLSK